MSTRMAVYMSAASIALTAGACMAQTDSFHLMQIQMAIGGVNGDTTAQAVQLRMRTSFQQFVQQGKLRVWDAAGQNPIDLIVPATAVANFNGGDTVLITTPAFDAACNPACVPDFHMTHTIPASYMAAGRLTWEDTFGTVYWSLAWGGAAYTGSNLGSIANSATGNFGPPFAGPLPTTGVRALAFQGDFAAAAGSNSTDYMLTSGAAMFTNNARTAFTVAGGSTPCYANCDGSTSPPVLTVNDFVCFQSAFASGASYANCDGSTSPPVLTVNDFVCFQSQFAAGCL